MLKKYFSFLYKDVSRRSGIELEKFLGRDENCRMLDCGCWDGINTRKFGKILDTKQLYGIEIVKSKAKEAEKNGVIVKISDLNEKLPFKDDFFDVIIAYHVIEHLVNVRLFSSELNRVLKKNGCVIIGTPNLASWHNVFALIAGHQPFSGPTIKPDYESDIRLAREINKERFNKVFSGKENASLDHIKVMTLKSLKGLLISSKFKIESFSGFGYYPLPPLLAKLAEKIDPYHTHYVIIKARK